MCSIVIVSLKVYILVVDLARDVIDRISTSGMEFYLNENLVTWASQKQQNVALSSCETEFMASTSATYEGVWIRRRLEELTRRRINPIVLYVDTKSTSKLMKNMMFHGRSKHIETRYNFIWLIKELSSCNYGNY